MKEVASFRAATYSACTKKSYGTHLKRYLEFCELVNKPPVPATPQLIAQFAAYLARTIKPASVRQYLNIVRILHLDSGLKNPMEDNWFIQSTLKGIDRLLGTPVNRKAPISPDVLVMIKSQLDLSNIQDSMFWAACLLMFFGLLRKSNLFPNVATQFNGEKQFIRSDFSALSDGSIMVSVKYSKTNQFHNRVFEVKLLCFDHVLSPVPAIHHAFRLCPLPKNAPAFVSCPTGKAMTGNEFNMKLKQLLFIGGQDPSRFSSHSFRRGGACWALQCGVPGEVIQQFGDWKSDAYKDYLDQIPRRVHDDYRQLMISKLPSN